MLTRDIIDRYLAGHLTTAEREALESVFVQRPELRKHVESLRAHVIGGGEITPDSRAAAWSTIDQALTARPPLRLERRAFDRSAGSRGSRHAGWALIVIAALAAGWMVWQRRDVGTDASGTHTVEAVDGSVTDARLPDGTELKLRGGSRLTSSNPLAQGERRVVLSETPFAEAAALMARHYGVALRVEGKRLRLRPVTATFDTQPLGEAITTLEVLTDAVASHEGDTIVFHAKAAGGR